MNLRAFTLLVLLVIPITSCSDGGDAEPRGSAIEDLFDVEECRLTQAIAENYNADEPRPLNEVAIDVVGNHENDRVIVSLFDELDGLHGQDDLDGDAVDRYYDLVQELELLIEAWCRRHDQP